MEIRNKIKYGKLVMPLILMLALSGASMAVEPGEQLTLTAEASTGQMAMSQGGMDHDYSDGEVTYFFYNTEIQAPDSSIIYSLGWTWIEDGTFCDQGTSCDITDGASVTVSQLGTYTAKVGIASVTAVYNTGTSAWEVTSSTIWDVGTQSETVSYPEPTPSTLFGSALGGLSFW